MSDELGKVHVLTGSGKGKTTAAFGLAMRAAGHGLKVCIIQFMKAGETTGEVLSARRLGGIDVAQYGSEWFVDSKHVMSEDKDRAREGLEHAKRALQDGNYQLVVLDEMNTVVSFGLLSADDVMDVLESRGRGVEVVLTGRNAPLEFIEYADYVSIIVLFLRMHLKQKPIIIIRSTIVQLCDFLKTVSYKIDSPVCKNLF